MTAACTVCGKDLPPVAVQHADDFCSSRCAREFWGNPLPNSPTTGATTRPSPMPWQHGTEAGYTKERCRCEPCTTAARVARAKRRERAA